MYQLMAARAARAHRLCGRCRCMGLVLVQNFTNCNEARGSAPKGTEGMLHDACWLCAEEAWHGGVNWCGADCWGHLCVCEWCMCVIQRGSEAAAYRAVKKKNSRSLCGKGRA